MKILSAEFITSSDCLKNCPDFNLPEIAMIGRSNVGKSSLINALANRKNLAKTSNTPGKTRTINFYKINEKFILADLPGYGYAKISKSEQTRWRKNLEDYLLNRKDLVAVIQLIDARHQVQSNDMQMRDWLDYHNIKVITLSTKSDTISRNEAARSLKEISETFNAEVIPFSAKTGYGKDKVLAVISDLLK